MSDEVISRESVDELVEACAKEATRVGLVAADLESTTAGFNGATGGKSVV